MATAISVALLSCTILLFTLGFVLVIVATATPWLVPREVTHTQILSVGLHEACFDNHRFETIDPDRRVFDGCVSLTSGKFDDIQDHINPEWFQDVRRIHFVSILLSSLLAILAIVFVVVHCTIQKQVKRASPLKSLLFAKAGLILAFVILCGLTCILLITEPSKFYQNFENNQATFFDNTNSQLIYSTGFSACIGAAVLFLLTTISGSVLMAGIFKKLSGIFDDADYVYGRDGSDDYSNDSHDDYTSQDNVMLNPTYDWSRPNSGDNKSQVSNRDGGYLEKNNVNGMKDTIDQAQEVDTRRQSFQPSVQQEVVSEYEREPSRIVSTAGENSPEKVYKHGKRSSAYQKPADSDDGADRASEMTAKSSQSRRRSKNDNIRDRGDFDQESRVSSSYSHSQKGPRVRKMQEQEFSGNIQEQDESVYSERSKRRPSSRNQYRDEAPPDYVERRKSNPRNDNRDHRHSRNSVNRRSKSYDDWDQEQGDSSTERSRPRRHRSRSRERSRERDDSQERRRYRSKSDGNRRSSRSSKYSEEKPSPRKGNIDNRQHYDQDPRRRSQAEMVPPSNSESESDDDEYSSRYRDQSGDRRGRSGDRRDRSADRRDRSADRRDRSAERGSRRPSSRGRHRSRSPNDRKRKKHHRRDHKPDGRSHSSQEFDGTSNSDNNLQEDPHQGQHDPKPDNRRRSHRSDQHQKPRGYDKASYNEQSYRQSPNLESESTVFEDQEDDRYAPKKYDRRQEDDRRYDNPQDFQDKPRNYSNRKQSYPSKSSSRYPDREFGQPSPTGSGSDVPQKQYRAPPKLPEKQQYRPVNEADDPRPTPARRRSTKNYDEDQPGDANYYGGNQIRSPDPQPLPPHLDSRLSNQSPGGKPLRYDRPFEC